MRVASINSLQYGSTDTIMKEISKEAIEHGVACRNFYGAWGDSYADDDNLIRFGSKFENKISAVLSRLSGIQHVYSVFVTLQLIPMLKKFEPDLIHLHNLHLWVINVPMLFKYIKKNNIKVIWTLHDCWAFTGQCPHFTMIGCDLWKTGCHNCPQIKVYPSSIVDNTKIMWKLKRRWFNGVNNMTIITPSQWLANLVKKSYLGGYPIKVINNGIDLNVFRPVASNFRSKYDLNDKFILLGVAFDWGRSKGLDVFCELSKKLDKTKYKIVLVGTDDSIDKMLPNSIISIHRTRDQNELAEIYSAANLFVNPTREDTYPTVNMEAIACGTPVLTFRTGGSPEIPDNQTGCVVSVDDIDEMERQIIRICTENIYKRENCVNRAKLFDANLKFREYIDLYDKLASDGGLA